MNSYNTCQQAVASERARDPSDQTKSLPTAVLKDFDTFAQIEALMHTALESKNPASQFMTLGTFGYTLQGGQLIADATYTNAKPTPTPQERLNFFTSTYAVESSDFTQAMPTTFDKQMQSNLRTINGNPITVTITYHNNDPVYGDTYTATLSAAGQADLILPYDPTKNTIQGTGEFQGVSLTYSGAALDPGSSATTQLNLYHGVADAFYLSLDAAITTYPKDPSTFDLLANEIKADQDDVEKNIKDKTKTMEEKTKDVLSKRGSLASIETTSESKLRMVKAFFGRKNKSE